MNEEQLQRLLRDLPRDGASSDFTSRVLRQLDQRPARSGWRWGRPVPSAILAFTGALLLTLGFTLWAALSERRTAARGTVERAQRIEELRHEYEQLEDELQMLRLLSAESRPLIGVEGNEEYDYLLDLREMVQAGATARQVRYEP